MGSALLLGSGLVLAQPTPAIDLDGEMAEAPSPYLIATQTIPDADATTMLRHVNLGATAALTITPGIALEAADRYFLRVELGGGAMFRGTQPAVTGAERVQGGAGNAQVVFRLGDVAVDGTISTSITDNIGLPSANAGAYTASMTVHNEQFDAIDGIGAIRSIGAEGVEIIRAVNGIVSTVTPATATADVGVGFLWFVNPDPVARRVPETANVSGVALGSASAAANVAGGVLHAGTGAVVTNADLIDDAAGVRITVSGDYSVGALDIRSLADADNDMMPDADCPARVGSAETPGMGGLQPSEDEPDTAMTAWMAPGPYGLCLEVDVAGLMSNATAIPKTEYEATVHTRTSATAAPTVASEGVIGVIDRNGAAVNIAYLTTSDKHNQRLIIVNRGSRPIEITDIAFHTEDGTEADLSDAAKAAAAIPGAAEIGPGETVVHRVNQMLSITGDSRRTAATLSFNGRSADVSVATTQVNLEDSSTDTVMWPVN